MNADFRRQMKRSQQSYKALVSSDWSECLSPNGPFDCIRFAYPGLADALTDVFQKYTGNQISLGEAAAQIDSLLPRAISSDQMDAYLDAEFETYRGVPELIQWCDSHDILFMLNSTGMIGYFQRVFAKKLLPRVAVLSAHPMLRYPSEESDPGQILELFETDDKGRHTAAVAKTLGIGTDRIVLMGDSGGDGPHFEWGSKVGAYLVSSMTKASLDTYCREKNIRINHRFGIDFSQLKPNERHPTTQNDFLDLRETIAERLGISFS